MATYSAGMTTLGAGAALRPVFSILSTATVTAIWREIAVWNTTATACTFRLVSFTAGTPGSTVASRQHRDSAPPSLCLAKGLYTTDITGPVDMGYRFVLGAAVGSAVILPIDIVEGDTGATAAIGLVPVGTGQVLEVKFTWEE